MTAQLFKQTRALGFATFLILLLLSIVAFVTVCEAYVARGPDHATNAMHDVPSETDDVGVDLSAHSAAIGIKQEEDVVVEVNNVDFCEVIWKNEHLMRHVPQRQAIKNLCKVIQQSEDGTTDVTDVTSISDEYGTAVGSDETMEERHDTLPQTTNLSRLTVWCKHRDQINNNMVRKFLPDICSNLENAAYPNLMAEPFGRVTTVHVTTESDLTTEAAEDVTSKTDDPYSPAVSSLEPRADVTFNLSDTVLDTEVCRSLDLVNVSGRLNWTAGLACKHVILSDAVTPAESIGAVRAKTVMTDSDATSEAVRDGTTEATYTSISQSVPNSVEPVTDVPYTVNKSDSLAVLCLNLHLNNLTSAPRLQIRALKLACRMKHLSDTVTPAESIGAVRAKTVMTESDGTSEAVMDGTTEAAYTSISQSVANSAKPVTDVPYTVNETEIWAVLCLNMHLTDAPRLAMKALKIVCRLMHRSGNETAGAAERTSSVTQQTDLSSQTSRLSKLREVCTHLDQVKKSLSSFFIRICANIDKTDAVTPAESVGAVRAKTVMTESYATSEAVMDGTTEATYTSISQSVANSVKPVTDVPYTVNETEIWAVLCLNLHLTDAPRLAMKALKIVCRMRHRPGNKTAGATERTSSVTQHTDQSSQTSRLSKLREVCPHLDQLRRDTALSGFFISFCANIDKTATKLPPGSFQTISLDQWTTESVAATEALMEGTTKSAYTHSSQSAVTSVEPAAGVTYSITPGELATAVCEYQHLLESPKTSIQRSMLKTACRPMECPRSRTAAATEATSGRGITTNAPTDALDGGTVHVPHAGPAVTTISQESELSVETPSLRRIREVCSHFDQIRSTAFKRPYLSIICSHLDEPGWTTEPCRAMTTTPRAYLSINDESTEESENESASATTQADYKSHETIDEYQNESSDKAYDESYEDTSNKV